MKREQLEPRTVYRLYGGRVFAATGDDLGAGRSVHLRPVPMPPGWHAGLSMSTLAAPSRLLVTYVLDRVCALDDWPAEAERQLQRVTGMAPGQRAKRRERAAARARTRPTS